ncbi:MAG TPA: hypothetical protein VJB59_00435 [Bdellovibrionota bacterium]|nr:hypothetical protein [Bdellovibrionota bacterium]
MMKHPFWFLSAVLLAGSAYANDSSTQCQKGENPQKAVNASAELTKQVKLLVTDPEAELRDLARADRKYGGNPQRFFVRPVKKTCTGVYYKFNPRVLNPGESLYFHVPEEFRTRPVNFVILGHRQDHSTPSNRNLNRGDRDSEPGLTSVQIHSSRLPEADAWRYWGGSASGEKGAKFAEIGGGIEVENLYEWQKKGHLSVVSDVRSTGPLYPDALRMVSLGKDPVIVNQLALKVLGQKPDELVDRVFSSGTEIGDPESAAGRKYGGGQMFGGKFPGALQLNGGGAQPKLPSGWRMEADGLHIPLDAGKRFIGLDVALGDTHPDGVTNEDGGTGSKGGAKLSIGLARKGQAVDWFMSRENVPPQGVLMATPTDCDYVAQAGDEVIIRSDFDTAYVMAIRLGYKNK